MRKYIIGLLLVAMMGSVCACGGETVSQVETDVTTEVTTATETNTAETTEETPTETSTEATTEETTEVQTTAVELTTDVAEQGTVSFDIATVPVYSGDPYYVINDNMPYFHIKSTEVASYEVYSDLDALGRCGVAEACVGIDIMPTEDRGSIGSVKPSGWHSVKYDCVDGKYLYNRCHLLGYQLTGENANEQNLITGTRSMNVDGMLPFENMIADYVVETQNHVFYRVTPIFEGDNLLATGVHMEAMSIEDAGDGIMFNVFVYNAQEGIWIDYATGESALLEESPVATEIATTEVVTEPIIDTNVKNIQIYIDFILNMWYNKHEVIL